MKRSPFFYILILALFGLSSCKKGVPNIANLKSLSGFSLDNSSVIVSSRSAPSFYLSGRCSDKFQDIEISFDNTKTWKSIKTINTASSIACATSGSFTGTLSPSTSEFASSLVGISTYSVYVRGNSSFGFSDAQPLLLNFAGKTNLGMITSGAAGGPLTTASYKMYGRIRGLSEGSSSVSSGSSYKLQGVLQR